MSNALVCAIVDGCGAPARELLAHAKLDEAVVRDITQRTSIVRLMSSAVAESLAPSASASSKHDVRPDRLPVA